MTNLTQKSSKQFFGAAMRVVTLAVFLVVFGARTALAQTRGYVSNRFSNTASMIDPAPADQDEQVPFTITATAVITGVNTDLKISCT